MTPMPGSPRGGAISVPWFISALTLLFTDPIVFDVFYERDRLLFGWSALYFAIRSMRDEMEGELRCR